MLRILGTPQGGVSGFRRCWGAGGNVVYASQVPIYQAQTTIEIQSINTDFLNIRQVNPVSDNADGYMYSDVQTQMRILQSDAWSVPCGETKLKTV
jgi:hypothetical protein